jgi:NAD(P)-dependent dehydrogenase (short-subunit alcohol dehydrogenase family)
MPTVLIAGASRGIGLEFARQYAADGWRVVAACREPDRASDLRSLTENADVVIHQVDVTSDQSVEDFRERIGGEAVDVLIITAGVPGGNNQVFGNIDFQDLGITLEVNVAGPIRIAQAFASNLSVADNSKLIAITSQMGSIQQTISTEMMLYRISKAALNEAWKCLSIDLKPRNVMVMVIHPGWVATDMGGKDAPVSPSESVRGMRKVIAGLSPADTGTFRTFEGATVPW